MESNVLEMFFENSLGKPVTLRVVDPREDLIPSEVKGAMDAIVALDAFDTEIAAVKSAQIVIRTVNEIELS